MKVCGNCLHWTRCADGSTCGVCYYPLPYWLEYISNQYVQEDNLFAKDCNCYRDYYLCSEDQD